MLFLLLATAFAAAAQPRLWFVDNARSPGNGSFAAPFATILAATAAAAPGDIIYVLRGTGSYREQVVLAEGQLLAGHGADLAGLLEARAIAAPSDLPALAAPPAILGGEGDALTLANGSSVAGIRLSSTSGRALVATNASGTLTVRDVTIDTATGTAVAIEGGDAKIEFVRSPIAAKSGAALVVRGRTGGTLELRDGSTIDVAAGVRDALVLERNQGEHTFRDAIRLTTTGARGIFIRGSSRVAMSSSESSVTAAKAAAVDIADTGISVFLRSASVDGAGAEVKRGISLENAPGTFRLDGGTIRNVTARAISIVRSSGVSLQNLVLEKNAADVKATPPCSTLTSEKTLDCSAAIYLADAADVKVSRTRIDDTGHTGIFGDAVTNLTLDTLTIEGAGDEPGEHGIAIRNLHGRSLIFGSTIKDSAARQLYVANRDGEGTLEIRKTRFDGGPPPAGQQGVLVELGGDAKFSFVVDDAHFTEHFSDGIAAVAADKSRLETFVHNSRFVSTASAVSLVADGEAHLEYRITGNNVRDAVASAISIHTRVGSGAASGTIAENTIGAAGVAGSGSKCGSCSGIAVLATRGGKLETTIRGNTIRQVDGYGIRVNARGTASMAVTIAGNTIAEPHGAEALSAIAVQSGALKADTSRLCADVSANRISGGWGIALAGRGSGTIALAGMTGDGAKAAAVSQYLKGKNNGAAVTATGTTAAVKSCL